MVALFSPPPFMRANASGVVVSFCSNAQSASDLATYTFSSLNIGAPSATRYVVVGLTCQVGAGANLTLSIGGISATQLVSSVGSGVRAVIFIAKVPTGTSANIVVNSSVGASTCAVCVWSLEGLLSPTPTSTGTASSSGASSSLTAVAGGVVIACSIFWAYSSSSWAGVIKDVDVNYFDGIAFSNSGGSSIAATSGSVSVSNTAASAVSAYAMAAVALR